MGHASKESILSRIVEEVRTLAELQALLQRQDWNPLKLYDELREASKAPRRKIQNWGQAGAERKRLIRLAALSIVGVWILDLEGRVP